MKNKFLPALNGLKIAIFDKSIQLQLFLGLFTLIGGWILKLSFNQWLLVISAIFAVVISEMINTCIEKVCDLMDTNYNEKIKNIKDLSAAFVLVACIYACIIAGMILIQILGGI